MDQLDDDNELGTPKDVLAATQPPQMPPLVPPPEPPHLPVKAQVSAQRDILKIMPTNIEECWRAGELFYLANMIPEGLIGKETDQKKIVARAALAIMKGSEVGLGPVTAISTIMIVNNKATIYGDGAKALVLASGKVEYEKVVIEGAWTDKNYKVTVILKRWDQKEEVVRSFSYADALRAGLIGKGGPNAPWTKYPERQVYWRAWSWAARDGVNDALSGLAVFEEVSDYEIGQRRLHDKTDTSSLDDEPETQKEGNEDAEQAGRTA